MSLFRYDVPSRNGRRIQGELVSLNHSYCLLNRPTTKVTVSIYLASIPCTVFFESVFRLTFAVIILSCLHVFVFDDVKARFRHLDREKR